MELPKCHVATMLVKASRPTLVQFLRQTYVAPHDENQVQLSYSKLQTFCLPLSSKYLS
jgi:hypothetical protein